VIPRAVAAALLVVLVSSVAGAQWASPRGWHRLSLGAGAGVYQITVEDGDPVAEDRRRDYKGLAWTALVGARLRLGPVTPFVEWRRTEFDTAVSMNRYAPLILGLHF
jgi:hypothetical protein